MSGPTVEELLKAGGQRRKPPEPEKVGAGETFINRAVGMIPGANRLTDALSSVALEAGSSGGTRATLTPQARAELQAMGEEVPEEHGLVDTYREVRDRRAERTATGSQQNPWAGRAGAAVGLGLSLAAPLPKVGTGLKGAMATGASYGALQGLTEGKADLTRGEVGQAFKDTTEGALWGGGAGAAGYGLMRLGQRGVQALRNARSDTLAQETEKLGAEAQAAQEAAAKEAEAARKEVGQAREMNKAYDAKAAARAERAQKVLDRARGRAGGPAAAPPEDPGTNALQGMSAKARQAQMSRSREVDRLQQRMGDSDVPTKVSEDWQAYIDQMPKAAERGPQADPGGLRRDFMEQYLHQRYPNDPERVARIMRERVGTGGEIMPRPSTAPAQEPEVLAALPQRRPGNMAYDVGGQRGPEFSKQLTAGGLQPSLEAEAEAAMAARRAAAAGADVQRGAAPVAQPASPEAWTPNAPRPVADPVLTAPPARRPGAAPLALDMGGRPGMNMEPTPASAPGVPTANLGAPAAPPAVQAPVAGLDDVTRLAGPQDVGALAAERAAQREVGGLGRAFHAGYAGAKEGGVAGATLGAVLGSPGKGAVLGSVIGGFKGLTREMMRDPSVKARILSLAKVQYLAQVNPELFARVGAPLTAAAQSGDDARYKAQKYLQIRTHPELRKAEKEASEAVSRMSDQQLMELIASGAPPQ